MPSVATVLIVDDDPSASEALAASVRAEGFACISAGSGEEALAILQTRTVELLLLAVELPGLSGPGVLKLVRDQHPDIGVLMLAGEEGLAEGLGALRLGALDVLARSCTPAELSARISRALEQLRVARELLFYREELARGVGQLVRGRSKRMREMLAVADKVANTGVTVLLSGERGCGKETLARYLHEQSERRNGPFVSVDLSTLPPAQAGSTLFGHQRGALSGATRLHPGKFELASGGTLFLKDVAALNLNLQGRLLRALQERQIERVGAERPVRVDLRVICATSESLEHAVREGRFREELYWRLKVVPIELPPLRSRREDIRELADHFLQRHSARCGRGPRRISDGAADIFRAYAWPGNLRELDNEMQRAVLTSRGEVLDESDVSLDVVMATALADGPDAQATLSTAVQAFERSYLRKALADNQWRRRDTAEALDIGYSTLKVKLKQYGIGNDED